MTARRTEASDRRLKNFRVFLLMTHVPFFGPGFLYIPYLVEQVASGERIQVAPAIVGSIISEFSRVMS